MPPEGIDDANKAGVESSENASEDFSEKPYKDRQETSETYEERPETTETYLENANDLLGDGPTPGDPGPLWRSRPDRSPIWRQLKYRLPNLFRFCKFKLVSSLIPGHLQELLEGTREGLNWIQQKKLEHLLCQYEDVIATSPKNVGRTNVTQHRIDTGGATPVKQLPRRLPMTRRDEVAKLIEEMAEQDVIEPSSSPWASPVVLVKKKDGSTRFCVDYRRLNDLTKKDSYPLPRIDATLDTLSGSQWFSTLDLKSGYWQVSIHPEDREKTAFTTGNGLWQFKVMPFGLCNAPATFERLMETVLQGIPLETCLVYLDDIIVMGKSFEEHLINLERVLQKIRGARLKLNPRKCKPFKEKVRYLGHVISRQGIQTDPDRTETVRQWPVPRDVHQLRSFLGLCSYYRRFVPGFSNIARPLHRLTESGRPFSWTIDCERAMDKLKQALSSPPMLAYPDPGEPFILDTDASNTGIGAVLSQTQDGVERVIAYFSKTLSNLRETTVTDHAALRWLLNFKSPEGQLARWIQRLQVYDMEIQHRKGKSHGNADALSRRPCQVNCKHCSKAETQAELNIRQLSLAEELKLDEWSPEEMRKSQFDFESDLRPVMNWLNAGTNRPAWEDVASCSPITKSYWSLWDSLEFRGGVLYRKWESEWKMILPQSRVPSVLKELHNSPSGGHFGIAKTLGKVKERFYWAGCRASVEKWVRQCTECASRKGLKTRSRARLKTYNLGAPVERIAIDIMGPLPRSDKGNRYNLVAMDYFTKWPEAFPLADQEAETVAETLISQFFSRFGVPMQIHTDQGRNFESRLFAQMCKLLGSHKTRTTPLHPQSDGMVERFNRTLASQLSLFVAQNQRDWDSQLPILLMAYRSSVHETTGYSPAKMLFGRELKLPCDLIFGCPNSIGEGSNEFVDRLHSRLEKVHRWAREKLEIASEAMKVRYDTHACGNDLQEGGLVWLYNPKRKKGLSPKLQKSWEGLFRIVKKLNDVVFRIQRSHPTLNQRFKLVSSLIPGHLQELLEGTREGLNWIQQKKLEHLLCQYEDVIATSPKNVGRTNVTQHRIDTGGATPVKQLPRRLPMTRRDEVAKLIEEMAEQDVIEPSSSPWASPVVLVKKKDGSTRFCVDYRRLNDLTKKDSYPLPRIDATLDTLSGSQWFSTLDLKSGYWQVSIHPEDREKTAFTTGNGLWQFKVMPFGLCNAPATFERLMETVLQGIPLETCLVYLDDIIVMGKSFEEHLINLERVLQKIRGARLKLNPRKCKPFKEKVRYLGHVISRQGIQTDPDRTETVRQWPVPRDVHQLRSFLGLCSYYRRFVPGFSNIARPLHRLTESGRPFSWTIDCERAMDKLKQALSSPPMLAYPDPGEPFILDTDASNTGIGAVLSQTQDGVERVIAYFSKTLSKPERNYCVTRRELLAIVKSIEHFHHYLYGQKFLLRTDHAALRWLLNFKSPEGQLARWIQRLQEYDMEIQHRKGKSHGNADALSRRPCQVNCKHCSKAETQAELNIRQLSLAEELKLDEWSPEEMRKSQFDFESDLRPVMNWLNAGTNRPAWEDVASCSPITKSYWSLWDSLEFRGGVLYRKWESEWKMILPQSRVPSVLKELHNSPSGGHFGIAKTLGKVKERFYWAGCRASVEKWVRQCTECASRKGLKTRSRARLKTYNLGAPVERIAIDIMGPLPRSDKGNRYNLVAMDYFTKWPEAFPLADQEAETVAETLISQFFSRFGVPMQIHTDQGRNFESRLFAQMCKLLGSHKTRTTPLHPQSDGMVERFNRTLASQLSLFVAQNQRDWDSQLPILLMAYRSSVHETTGYSPAKIWYQLVQ
ncbi:K02A2.6-like [Cordylochernes scorpioides]|uniref:RNA-directed DNA polymerase n=1 Tax=Cordylochernes scorpioides TaxID=51811 RepID=A0ABY6LYB5_9ARAC|nr:K02A2.6-like [Cordylochernes scorpioides]